MRRVERSKFPPPRDLVEPGSKGLIELEESRAHIADPAKRKKAFPFKAYKVDGVKAALHGMFHGKCAYCESFYQAQAPVDVEHFRPKGAVEGEDDHPGYWWLAMAWENLLPSCIDCNRRRRQKTPTPKVSLAELNEAATETMNTGKKDAFPIAGVRAMREIDQIGGEDAYLIDPSREDPGDYLEFYINHERPIGLVLPKTRSSGTSAVPDTGNTERVISSARARKNAVRGAVSIQIYGLNRWGLVQARTRILQRLEFLRQLVLKIDQTSNRLAEIEDDRATEASKALDDLIELIIAEIAAMAESEQPYSAMVRQWIDAFKQELAT